MKWICVNCKAINPEFSYSCHNCGKNKKVDEMEIRLKNKLKMIIVFIIFAPFFCIGQVASLVYFHFSMGYFQMDKKLEELYKNGLL
jgi:ribosomal protein L40E